MKANECLLAELPAARADERLLVVLSHDHQGSHVSLRQQSWADGIGWFDQKSLDLDPDQLHQLRAVLGWKQLQRATPAEDQAAPVTLKFPSVTGRAANQ